MEEIKLHLGCGSVHMEGFVNIDEIYLPSVDVVDNVQHLRRFEAGSVALIYASNVLEHLGRWNYPMALKRWYDLLKKDGILRLSVPDFNALCEYYMETKDLRTMYCALHGGQDTKNNVHYWCWDFETLKQDLSDVGYVNIHRYDRNQTEHSHVRDWSLNYMPYRDNNGEILPDEEWFKGKCVALNVECQK